jgi:NadR type nicotinamide-nucleotide adenylyltransferase
MFKTGAVIGKFYPFHLGHKYLIDVAQTQAQNLYIMVCWNKSETIPAELRYKWLSEAYPSATVMLIEDLDYDQEDSKLWAKLTKEWLGFTPEAVFTSEKYGDKWAEYLGCKHVQVDIDRKTFPVSGTKIRSNPYKNWELMTPTVRSYFAKKVVLVGSESTGKSTLSQDLAKHYKTVWVPEYGRTHWEARLPKGADFVWSEKDFIKIAVEQNRHETELISEANKVLICDTDVFATSIWFERYMNYKPKIIDDLAAQSEPSLYILTDVDTPFEDDGTRDGEHLRVWMHRRFVDELTKKNVPWISVSGSRSERLKQAVKAIDALIN